MAFLSLCIQTRNHNRRQYHNQQGNLFKEGEIRINIFNISKSQSLQK
jgi:hypothetical protein